MSYLYIFGALIFTVYGQIILKWRLNTLHFSITKGKAIDIITSFAKLLIDPYILSGFMAAFIASIFWMAAMTKFDIIVAYPFMSLAPAFVFILGVWLLGETFTVGKVIGLILIILGLIVTVKY